MTDVRRIIPLVMSAGQQQLVSPQERGRCLVDYEMNERIQQGKITSFAEGGPQPTQIQPGSFEPTLSPEIYYLNTEAQGLLRPKAHMPVEEVLHKIPKIHKTAYDASKGVELQRGCAYLVRLQETFYLEPQERIKASPKSSIGRIFLRTRTLADFNPCSDEFYHSQQMHNKPFHIWALLQPYDFNVIVHAGQSLPQLRFFTGDDALLADSELRALCKQRIEEKEPILAYAPFLNVAAPHRIGEGLHVHLDLEGRLSKGIVALRARRHVPEAIDLRKTRHYDPLVYFEPIRLTNQGDTLKIEPNLCYLLSSLETVHIPLTANAELEAHPGISLHGDVHLAGFFDEEFWATAVFEVRSTENDPMIFSHGDVISRLKFYRGNIPREAYGNNSHYVGQVGPQPAKFFLPIDYSAIALAMQRA